ncbi:MAG: NAD-glutamate dehydrogenase domain-containing protein [Sphingopyxis sp.]
MPKHKPKNAPSDIRLPTPENNVPEHIVSTLCAELYDSALPDDAVADDMNSWREAATFLAETAMIRAPGQTAIALETQAGHAGERRMRLVLVNDDMPFLVDSAAATVAASGLAIFKIVHPVVAVRRDATNALTQILDRETSGERRESMIYMEIARADAKERRQLMAEIHSVLADVRAAVADWLKLQAAMHDDAESCRDSEAAALLRWFLDRNFTQLGHEKHLRGQGRSAALGLCCNEGPPMLNEATIEAAITWFERGGRAPLIIKSNRVSGVHRRVLIDLIIMPIHDITGLKGISIHAGLWTSSALTTPPDRVPMLRNTLSELLKKFDFDPSGHAGKALAHVLTQLPHDLLIAVDSAQIEALALTAMSIADRPRPKLHLLMAALQRHLFAFVWLPRDEVSTARRLAIEAMLTESTKGRVLSWSIAMEDGGAALLRYAIDIRDGATPDAEALDHQLERMVRGWVSGVEVALSELGEGRASVLAARFAARFPAAYRLSHSPEEAALDILRIRDLNENRTIDVRINHLGSADTVQLVSSGGDNRLRLKVYSVIGALPLSGVVPALENFGFTVVEEVPTSLQAQAVGEREEHVQDFLLDADHSGMDHANNPERARIIEVAIANVLMGHAENDAFNQLILQAGVAPHAIVWLRSWFRYLRQAGANYGLLTFVSALRGAPDVTRGLVDLFIALHHPKQVSTIKAGAARAAIIAGLGKVAAIDEDRILRLMQAVIEATLRTNAFAPSADEALAFKLDSHAITCLPRPLPWREIFVYSSRVEGIHLRAGPIARGGLRWSDRRDDFRTEILGLMKAQRVKNAVIVPTGAKGGFYPKQLPDIATNRDAWLTEGTECYRIFIRTLLSITDNLIDGSTVHPAGIVIRDDPDPYFVVAADKGTATFSDIANAIAIERGFWLGDAFASGGSNGYDHKAMGITAKGAWISVQRHFREMGLDAQSDAIRTVGVGDMSGDVFGNGMLLSKSIKLVAAFDHRHIFIDPDPDMARSFAERARLFALPRSSWADFDTKILSKGGGIFPRNQKMIALSPEARAALGLEAEEIEPAALMSAILTAEVDLIWFGGIGTYVKAAEQNNADVGDPANDRLRVDAQAVRAKVIGEGANLGITQAARIVFAANGGRINTDFIDNSAGVDCSDNEVNIKIALNKEVRDAALSDGDRNILLSKMTDQVGSLVLNDNRLQALALSIAECGGASAMPSILRLIEQFEASGHLDRAVEGIAPNEALMRRTMEQRGLTRPELAVILSTAKLALQAAAEGAQLGDDPLMDAELLAAFPAPMVQGHSGAILSHQLRNAIVATKVANRLINRMGLTHPFELAEEEGVGLSDVVEAFVVAEKLFHLDTLWRALDEADTSEDVRLMLYCEVAIEVRAHMADLIRNGVASRSLAQCVADLAPGIDRLDRLGSKLLLAQGRDQANAFAQRLIAKGASKDIAASVVHLAEIDGAVGIVALACAQGVEPEGVTRAFTAFGHATGLDWAQGAAMQLSPTDPWERLLVAGLARDFQQMRLETIARLGGSAEAATGDWLSRNQLRVQQFRTFVSRAQSSPSPSPAMLAQLAGQARTLLSRH